MDKAVEMLMAAYNKSAEIEEVKKLRKIISEKRKFLSDEIYNNRLMEVEKLKLLSKDEKKYYIKKFEDFEILKVQYESYAAMDRDVMNYNKFQKEMNKKIKKIREEYKKIRELSEAFDNLKIEWK